MTKRIKYLLYQSWHRGTKENDLLLGQFAKHSLSEFTESELDTYEQLLNQEDVDIFSWISGGIPLPPGNLGQLVQQIRDYHKYSA